MIIIEIFAILIVVLVQVGFFVENLREIRRVKSMFPADSAQLSLITKRVDLAESKSKSGVKDEHLLSEIENGVAFHYSDQPEKSYTFYYEKNEREWIFKEKDEGDHLITIDTAELSDLFYQRRIIIENGKPDTASYTVDQIIGHDISPDFQQILSDTNNYLRNNKGATADFNLLRDIAERWSGTIDNKIQTSVATPLYVGLVGTFLGVILGILSMIDFGSGKEIVTDATINMFLTGVLVAMVGSGFGLLLTLIGNYQLKGARAESDTQKNQYYTWLQTSLLPNLHDDVSNSLLNLKTVLDSFNSRFFNKLDTFHELFGNLSIYIDKQKEFLDKLDKIGYQRLVNENLAVFNKVQESAELYENFVNYQTLLNKALSEGKDNVSQLTDIAGKLVKVEQLHKSIAHNEEIISKQLSLLSAHENKIKYLSDAIAQHFDRANDDIAKVVEKRIQLLQKEEQNAGEHLHNYFDRLKEESPYQKISEEIGNAFASLRQHMEVVKNGHDLLHKEIVTKLESDTAYQQSLNRSLQKMVDQLEKMAATPKSAAPEQRQDQALLNEVRSIGMMLHAALNKRPWWERLFSYIRRKFRKRR